MSLTASAPGSIMLSGEHAVVYGHRALVCAIEQRVTVRATPLPRPEIEISSEIAPPLRLPLGQLPSGGPYRFVLAALALYPMPVRLEISSQIDPTLGLGSSAAVTIAVLGALNHLAGVDPGLLHEQALGIVRSIQGRGSGADLAASLSGGMVAYRPGEIRPLPAPPPLSLCYAGYKTPTAQVLAQIAAAMQGREAEFEALYARMGASSERAIAAAQASNWLALARELNAYQTLMAELGVSDPTLDRLIAQARADSTVMAAKISGSGLGDCVVAVGGTPPEFSPAPLAEKGLVIDD